MSDFDGKVALITGGASGIGKEVAVRFAAAGGIPVIADLNVEVEQVIARELGAQSGRAFAVAMDVADEVSVNDAVAKAFSKFQRVDILVSNAGIQIVKPVIEFRAPRKIAFPARRGSDST